MVGVHLAVLKELIIIISSLSSYNITTVTDLNGLNGTDGHEGFGQVGIQPPAASWGLMVNQSKQFLFTMPWLALAPCVAIMLVVLAFNFLGDGLVDALDPNQRNL